MLFFIDGGVEARNTSMSKCHLVLRWAGLGCVNVRFDLEVKK